MDKAEVAAVLEEIGALLEIHGDNPFRVRAYYNAARVISGLQGDLGELCRQGALIGIKGIGKDLAGKISELQSTGRLPLHEQLRRSLPPGLLEMTKIPGFGPKRAKAVYDELGVEGVDALEKACRAGRVARLAGFGARSQEKLLAGIAALRRFSGRHLQDAAQDAARPVLEALRLLPGVIRCGQAGSLRRGLETIGDLDFLVSAGPRAAAAVMEAFVSLPGLVRVIERGPTRASVVLPGGIQADLRVVSEAQYSFALAYFTGSKAHNIALRGRALKRKGLSLNEYGFSPARAEGGSAKELGSSIACRDEAAIYKALGLAYIPPELREDMGEIEAAEAGRLPDLVADRDIRGAFHCHTDWSDGRESAEAMAQAALDRGWSFIGLADHSVSQRQARGLDARRARAQTVLWRKVRDSFARKGLRVFAGTECDILPDGRLDFDDKTLALFDYVAAAVHSGFGMDREAMTRRILKALEHPRVTMLAHPTGRLLLQRDPYAVDIETVLKAAARRGVLVEINSHPMRLDLDWRFIKRAKELGARCVINPDAHDARGLDTVAFGVGIARKGWLTRKDLVNCLDAENAAEVLARKR